MSSLNLSTNGPSITKSYQSVINAPLPTGAAANSATYGQWAVFSVAAPLMSAFQNDGGKESVMKVQSTGEGELIDFIEEFNDGRIQFGFLKVKDPNTTLPKNVFVGWVGQGVPERTKGYFTSHQNAVAKLFQGYHVQITARSDADLTPEGIIQKVADASGSKYSGGGSIPKSGGGPPPLASKPVFTPTRVGGGSSGFQPLGGSRRVLPTPKGNVDDDGWGADAPQVTRTQLEKVPSSYKPTKVILSDLTANKEPSRYEQEASEERPDVVRGAYQPIGKVDIAEIRRMAKAGGAQDDRPTAVKGAYEPVGKVDIAAIRAKAQPAPSYSKPEPEGEEEEAPKSLSDRSAAFQQSERITSLPKPKVANKFGGASAFSGTRAPVPVGFNPINNAASAPIGTASKTYADEGGKTPAQLWAEKKARQGGGISPAVTGPSPVQTQKSGGGGWKSGYSGKSWSAVQTTRTGQSAASIGSGQQPDEEEPTKDEPEFGNVGSIRDRFAANPPPPAMDLSSKPNARSRAIPEPEVEEDEYDARPSSPIRVALPVSRAKEQEPVEEEPPALPKASMNRAVEQNRDLSPEPRVAEDGAARGAGIAAAETTFGAGAASANPGFSKSGKKALIQYDYEKAEDNEIELKEGEYVTDIEQVDDDWWMGQNSAGESGLFPANYVEIVEEEDEAPAPPPAAAAAAAPSSASKGPTATAQYDYEAAEPNELSFPDGAKVINLVSDPTNRQHQSKANII